MTDKHDETVEIIDLTNETHGKHNTTITIDDSFVACNNDSPDLETIDEQDELFKEYPPEPSPLPVTSVESSPKQSQSPKICEKKKPERRRASTPIFYSSSSSPSPPSSQVSTPLSRQSSSISPNKSSSSSRSLESALIKASGSPKMTKSALRELKKKEREESKREKKRQKEEEKLLREANRANAASRALDNCAAKIDRMILNIIHDQDEVALRTLYDESMIKYEIVDCPNLSKSITWTYRRVEIENGKCEETFWDSEWTIVVMEGEDYLKRLLTYRDKHHDSDSLKNFLINCKKRTKTDLIVVVYNLAGHLKSERMREAKSYKKTFKDRFEGSKNKEPADASSDPPVVTSIGITDLQELRLRLELEIKHEIPDWKLHFEFQEKTNDAVQLFARYTSSVAKLEIKKRTRTSTGIDWAINVDKERAVDPCKSSEDLTKLWIAQLQQFTQITLPIAKAVAAEYPSPCALLDQYGCLTEAEGENLLAELYIQRNLKRQIGASISKRIYRFMTCEDPDVHINLS